ncbi:MAG: magnesium transporter [Deltaproteobacteria bacterium]
MRGVTETVAPAVTPVLNEALIEEVKASIRNKRERSLKALIDAMRPADVADLVEHLDNEERLWILDLLNPEGAGEVLLEMESPVQSRILSELDNDAISQIVQELDSDDAADLVGDLPAERAKEIIESVEAGVSIELKKLLVENVYYLFVVDDFRRLVGVVSLKDLVVEPPERKIRDIMNPEVISTYVYRDQEEVAHLVKKYDLVAVPVVDEKQRLVGRITHDDIIDVIEEEADEDMALMAGVIRQEVAEDSAIKISRARLPWLMAGLFGGIVAAVVIDQFESSLEKIIALSFFFPVIMALGGNTGIQAATVAVRGLATGDISLMNIGKRIWVELKVAFVNGLVCGLMLGAIVGYWLSDFFLGAVISFSLVAIVINSGLIGAAVPLALKRLKVDPALATGPFVTTSNDIFSLLIYLALVTLYLKMTA